MPTRRTSTCGRAALCALALSPAALAQAPAGGAGWLEREHLAGDLGGRRAALADAGVEVELFYTLDAFANVDGGARRSTAAFGDVDLMVTADAEQLFGWRGGTFFLYGLGIHGDSLSALVGDLQVASNIESPTNLLLFEAWYEQSFDDGRFSLLGGLLDVNSEFDVIPAATLFLNSAHGIGSEFGNSGLNGPSTFPATSLALRAYARPTETLYARAVVADGVPGDLSGERGTRVRWDGDEGLLLAAEVGFYNLSSVEPRGLTRQHVEELPPSERRYGNYGKYAVGAWGYTTEFDDFHRVDGSGNPEVNDGSYGVYALAEQRVFYEDDAPQEGLSTFARLGLADQRTNLFEAYAGAGLVYHGPFPGRGDDHLGLAVAAARLGDDFRRASFLAGKRLEKWEVATELTYAFHLAPWLRIQPDVQYVVNPGGDPSLDDALVVGARLVVSF